MMIIILKILLGSLPLTSCTIDGLSYMDPLKFRPYQDNAATENPCNPLYWYPKPIPDYCYEKPFIKNTNVTKNIPLPPPLPIPPIQMPLPVPVPYGYPLPFGVPLAPTAPMIPAPIVPMFPPPMGPMFPPPMGPMLPGPMAPMPAPVQPSPYALPQPQIGMVPGLPGIVSPDGGLNILPFSDVYSDVLEKHKQKMMNRRLQGVLDDYDDEPWSRRSRKRVRKIFYD